ncbi:SDR family oxidoreductase [Pseudomonas sp.]|uniref:SDR family NAD(P)-dependent oxidoreductase n=1 Tax=Pseudomonas sp. TaxID=306 RepID=UPI0031B5DEE4
MSGSVVIVSGGTYGLGRDMTVQLAKRGHRVIAFGLEAPQVSSIASDGIAGTRAALAEHGLEAMLLEADTSVEQDVQRVIDAALSKYGAIHGLVANAAIGPLGTVTNTSPEVWNKVLAVNLTGTYLCARSTIPHMKAAGGGSIVIVGSGAGWGKANMAAYAASKGGLNALAAAMAYDHFHDHIRVNVVIPGGGGIVSGMSVGRVGGDPNNLSRSVPGTVAGRVANGEDLASAVGFLLSDEASVISGSVLDVGCFAHQGGPIPAKAQDNN